MTLNVNTLQAASTNILVPSPHSLYATGHIIQTKHIMAQERLYFSVPENNSRWQYANGTTPLHPLRITITPKSAESLLYVEFNCFFETDNNVVFLILRNDNVEGAGWDNGQDTGIWNGAGVSRYDNNTDSTPAYITIPWVSKARTTSPVTFCLGIRYSNRSTYGFTFNSTYSNYQNGADAYEQGVSFAIVHEIAV